MKTKLLLLTSLLASSVAYSQDARNYQPEYIDSIVKSVFDDTTYSLNSEMKSLEKKEKKTNKYNSFMLNSLFTSLLNEKALASSDLSTSTYYATISDEDNILSFGFNFNTSNSPLNKRSLIGGVGFNLKSKSGFATISKNGELQNRIYLTGKIGHINNGVITFFQSDNDSYKRYYKMYLRDTYRNKMKSVLKKDGAIDVELKKLNAADTITNNSFKSELEKTKEDLVSKIAKEEMEALEKYRWYKRIRTFVWSAQVQLPVSVNQFRTAANNDSITIVKESQYLWNASINGTFIWKCRNSSKFFLTGRGKVENSNNALTEDLATSNYLTIVSQSPTNIAVTNTESDVYIGDFSRFVIGTLGIEGIWYPHFFKNEKCNFFGFSASLEQTVIGTNFTNWKVGIPLKFRNDEGKGVNLELQCKEVNKNLLVGIRAGFVLGKFVK